MGYKKKLANIVAAVEGVLGDSVRAKKLKKAKALRRFIKKMESKRTEISVELMLDDLPPESRGARQRNLETLDNQIRKANDILDEIAASQ